MPTQQQPGADDARGGVGAIPDLNVYYFREPHCAYQYAPRHGKRLVSLMAGDRAALAADPDCPKSFMMLLSNDEMAVREALAGNPGLTLRIMRRLARAGGSPALVLARRPDAPPEVLGIVAAVAFRRKRRSRWLQPDVHEEVLKAALGRPDCPPAILAHYARRDSFCQRLVAANPNCPRDSLDHLAVHGDHRAMANVAANPNCPRDSLDHLAAHGGHRAMANVAANPAATAAMLSRIVARAWRSDLAHKALLRLIATDWARARPHVVATGPGHRQELVRQSPAAARHMAADPDWRLRYAVAVAGGAGQQLRNLAADPHGRVRRAASQRLLALVAA